MTADTQHRHDTTPSDFDRIGLDGFWIILRRHLRMMMLIVIGVIGVTALVLTRLDERFTARSTLVLTGLDTRVSRTDTQLESFELSRAVIETEMDVLRSRAFAAQVADSLALFDDPTFVKIGANPSADNVALHQERVLDKLQSAYKVFRSGESLAIDIIATADNAKLAAKIANGIADVYIQSGVSEQKANVSKSIDFLRTRVATLGEELTLTELDLADFIRENKLDDDQLPERLRSQVQYLTTILRAGGQEGQDAANTERLTKELASVEAALQDRTRAELTQMRKERLLELQRSRYQTAIEKLNELETQIQLVGQGARQVSVARAPASASWPNKTAALIISAIGGLVLACVVALVLDLMNRRLWNEEQTIRVSGMPNAGFLPRFNRSIAFRPQDSVAHYLLSNPRSMFAQAVRSATGLWFDDESDGWVVMITSGLPHEGKSTVTVALGLAAAVDGLKVLVIDMDSHREDAARLLESSEPPSKLADAVSGAVRPSPVVIKGERIEGLDLISLDARSSANLKDQRKLLSTLKEKLHQEYDLIVIDTPPVLVVDDTLRIGILADEIWQVVRWGRTSETVLRDTVERLKRDGLPISATIINDVDTRRHRRLGYGGYAQYYNYGEGYYK